MKAILGLIVLVALGACCDKKVADGVLPGQYLEALGLEVSLKA